MFLLLIIIVLVLLYYVSTKNFKYWQNKGVKFVKPVPLFGNMMGITTKTSTSLDFIKNMYNAFPNERFSGCFQGTSPTLIIKDPELLKKITIKHFDHFTDHLGFASDVIDPLYDKSLFFSKGETWRNLRQTISPVFTSSKIRMMFTLMDDCAKDLLTYFKTQTENLIPIEMKDISSRFASDIIATVAFGIKCDSLTHRKNQFLLAGKHLSDFSGFSKVKILIIINFPTLAKWLQLKLIKDEVSLFLNGIINETISVREKKNIIRPDLIHLLMMARKGNLPEDQPSLDTEFAAVQEPSATSGQLISLTNEDITAQAVIFFLGGFESISSSISFTSYELALQPQIQKRLHEEILKVEEPITYEKLSEIKYLDMVVSESLRKWTSFAWIDRRCTKTFIIEPENKGEKEVKIDVGDVCWIPTLAIQRDPKYWEEPEKFDPERFSEENRSKITPFTYIPFGNGPRSCVGSRFALLEIKIFFYYLLRDFEIVPNEKTEIPLKLSKSHFTVTADKGFHLGLKRIQH